MMMSRAFAACLLLCVSAAANAQAPTIAVLHSFPSDMFGTVNPISSLVQGRDGAFYGVTLRGPGEGSYGGFGTIYRITADGTFTTVYSFTGGIDGTGPAAALLQASDGHLYGTTVEGGSHGRGVAFVVTLDGSLTVLHAFTGSLDGASVRSALIEGRDGNFYGTTTEGGTGNQGTIFKMAPDGTLTTLYAFPSASNYAGPSEAGLVQAVDGNFYGVTSGGGTAGMGTVFRMTPEGTVTTLHSFPGAPDGANPNTTLVQAIDGNLYGTTMGGASANADLFGGTVFRVTLGGAVTTVHRFQESGFGGSPVDGLLAASDLHLYGTSRRQAGAPFFPPGTTYYFRMDFDGGVEFFLEEPYHFTGRAHTLVEGRDGSLYGTWDGFGEGFGAAKVLKIFNGAMPCNDKLTVNYQAGTLNLGFSVATFEPATWYAWLAVTGPPEQLRLLWSAPIPVIFPARFVNVPVVNFPPIKSLFVLTALQQTSGRVCADWKLLDTGP